MIWRNLTNLRWNLKIGFRALTGRRFLFTDAPYTIVAAWATKNVEDFAGWPELQDAVGYAQGELAQRANRWVLAPVEG